MSEKLKLCKPDSFTKWLIGLLQEDEDMGYGYIERSRNQLRQLYKMYCESLEGTYEPIDQPDDKEASQ